jgi:predicted O-linked N-acetylglucosamine transferase (SPINDLY family)
MSDFLQEAVRLHQAGRHAEAETRYRAILAREPANADALHYLGLLAYGAGEYDRAADLLQQSVRANDGNAVAWSNLGNALAMLARLPDAEAAFRRALRVDPGLADAAFNLGNTLRQQQKYASAVDSYGRAIAANPMHTGALNNLALVLDEQGKTEAAAKAYILLADALQDLGRGGDAVKAYWQSLDRVPNPGIEIMAALLTPVIPASTAEIDESRQRVTTALTALSDRGIALPDPLRYGSGTIFYSAYQGRNDRELRTSIAKFYLGANPQLGWTAPHCVNYAGPDDKIRIGIVSWYLRPDHPIGKHFGAIASRLDTSRFEVHRFAFDHPDSMPVSGTTMLPVDDLAAMRERVAAARLDVLFYTDIGMEPCTYFLAFSRLAPVQCVTFGHPVTTGIPNIDYFISSASLEPPGAQEHYSETLVLLAGLPSVIQRPKPTGAVPQREDFGLPANARVYVCAQNPIKFHPDFDAVVASILRRDPQGVLVLFDSHKNNFWNRLLLQRFQHSMPDVVARVVVLPFLKFDAFLGFLATADAVLDTPHFSGGTSTYEAFALDIPIVAWEGEFARGRQTAALYRKMGITDLIANSADRYVNLALRLAQDKEWRAQRQQDLRQRRDILYDNDAAIAELGRFFGEAVAAAVRGRNLSGWPPQENSGTVAVA